MTPRTLSEWRPLHISLLTSKKWRRTTDDARSLYIPLHLRSDWYGSLQVVDLAMQCFPGLPDWDNDDRLQAAIDDLSRVRLAEIGRIDNRGLWIWLHDYDDHQPQRSKSKRPPRKSPEQPHLWMPTLLVTPCGTPTVTPVITPTDIQITREEKEQEVRTNVLMSTDPTVGVDQMMIEPPSEIQTNPKKSTDQKPLVAECQTIWDEWLNLSGINPNTLKGKALAHRKALLRGRVLIYGADTIMKVIRYVCRDSQWHRENGVKGDILTICSSDARISKYLMQMEENASNGNGNGKAMLDMDAEIQRERDRIARAHS